MDMEQLVPPETSKEAIDLLRKLLEIEPSRRISAEKALKLDFFNDLPRIK